jgi:protein SCO1/2
MSKRHAAGSRIAVAAALVLVAGAAAVAIILLTTSSSAPGGALAVGSIHPYGTALDTQVPERLLRLPLTNQDGQTVRLADWRGKEVLLVPFLSLCTDICPMTTGNLLSVYRSLLADGAASHVQIVELTVDPRRDTPARLAAYAKLTGARWQLVTASPSELAALAQFFRFTYEQVPQDTPPAVDWWTGKPLTYDVDHSDDYYVIDGSGSERIVDQAAPSFRGRLNPRLYRFLSAEGREHLADPERPSWTTADALQALGAVLERRLALQG